MKLCLLYSWSGTFFIIIETFASHINCQVSWNSTLKNLDKNQFGAILVQVHILSILMSNVRVHIHFKTKFPQKSLFAVVDIMKRIKYVRAMTFI